MHEKFKNIISYCLICFILGLVVGYKLLPPKVLEKQENLIPNTVKSKQKTEISYIEKNIGTDEYREPKVEKTDIEMELGKQELSLKINGQESVLKKDQNEKFVFDKNKLVLTQNSNADINISVPTIDKTKYWSVGIGSSGKGVSYVMDFPINRKSNLGGWIYKDDDKKVLGIKVHF